MNNIFPIALLCSALLAPCRAAAQTPAVQVLYPYESQRIADVPQTFIFGNVSPAKGTLHINGQAVGFYPNGAFLAFLPVNKGDFIFTLEFTPDPGLPPVLLKRTVKIGQAPRPPFSTDKPELDDNSVQPSYNIEYRDGDCFTVSAQGSPGMEADFTIEDVAKHAPMTEQPPLSGKYYGLYCVTPKDEASSSAIKVRLSKGWSHAKAEAKGRLTLTTHPRVAEVISDYAGLRSDYDG
ncbi:MAG TPA: hypothetical protein PLL10_01175, partial [Elusimicrobiales bacterium]|nr:hypothetical protein [Elusimicrobiales bacterium]